MQPFADSTELLSDACGLRQRLTRDGYATWTPKADQNYWYAYDLQVVPLDRSYYERRDQMAFEMAEHGDPLAHDALLRIVQHDPNPQKRARAEALPGRAQGTAR